MKNWGTGVDFFLVDLQRKTVPRNKKQKCAGRWRFLFWFFFWVSLRTCSPSVPAPKKKEKKREKTRQKTRKRFVRQRVRSVVNHSLRLCVGSFSFFFADRNLRPRCRLVSVPNDVGLFCLFFFGSSPGGTRLNSLSFFFLLRSVFNWTFWGVSLFSQWQP